MKAPTLRRPVRRSVLLVALVGVALLVALLTPESSGEGGALSSYATEPGGAALAFELARHFGWQLARRTTPLGSTVDSESVHVVIGPDDALGSHEVHRLLNDVRAGGALLVALDEAPELADSLGVRAGVESRWLPTQTSGECAGKTPARAFPVLPVVRDIRWRRRPPGRDTTILGVTGFGVADEQHPAMRVGVGVPLGRGRIAMLLGENLFRNDAVSDCSLGADVAVLRLLAYVRPERAGAPTLVVDEYHHGFGEHPGSVRAVTHFLAATPSGRFLFQVLIAGLVLLLARAPRPLVPGDPARIARRSPLEHADALGHAYYDVDATRTATQTLLAGVRRRVGRVAAPAGATDDEFLDAVVRRAPAAAANASTIRRALHEPLASRTLSEVGDAILDIERCLSAPISNPDQFVTNSSTT